MKTKFVLHLLATQPQNEAHHSMLYLKTQRLQLMNVKSLQCLAHLVRSLGISAEAGSHGAQREGCAAPGDDPTQPGANLSQSARGSVQSRVTFRAS